LVDGLLLHDPQFNAKSQFPAPLGRLRRQATCLVEAPAFAGAGRLVPPLRAEGGPLVSGGNIYP
jgi:hypothetical protein